MDPIQFRDLVIAPTLRRIELYSEAAANLLLGTALHESGGLRYIRQLPDGPALGPYQMEPDTHHDLYENYLNFRPRLLAKLADFTTPYEPQSDQLIWNFTYATAVARLQYFRKPEPLPPADDLDGLADYWKKHWNTERGAGTVEQFIEAWQRFALN